MRHALATETRQPSPAPETGEIAGTSRPVRPVRPTGGVSRGCAGAARVVLGASARADEQRGQSAIWCLAEASDNLAGHTGPGGGMADALA